VSRGPVVCIYILTLLTLTAPLSARKAPTKKSADTLDLVLGPQIPLGVNDFFLGSEQQTPARQTLYVMSTAQSPRFAGWHLVEKNARTVVLAPDGSPVRHFPSELEFRVSASAMDDPFVSEYRDFLDLGDGDLNQFLLGLQFRVKIFHGLDVTAVWPRSVRMIGMPAEVSYPERIYRVSFSLPSVPIDDRIVLEVLTPRGDRMCKFHLDF